MGTNNAPSGRDSSEAVGPAKVAARLEIAKLEAVPSDDTSGSAPRSLSAMGHSGADAVGGATDWIGAGALPIPFTGVAQAESEHKAIPAIATVPRRSTE